MFEQQQQHHQPTTAAFSPNIASTSCSFTHKTPDIDSKYHQNESYFTHTPNSTSTSNNPKIFYTRKELYTALCGFLLIGFTIVACFYIITLSLYQPEIVELSHQVCESKFIGNSTNATMICTTHEGRN